MRIDGCSFFSSFLFIPWREPEPYRRALGGFYILSTSIVRPFAAMSPHIDATSLGFASGGLVSSTQLAGILCFPRLSFPALTTPLLKSIHSQESAAVCGPDKSCFAVLSRLRRLPWSVVFRGWWVGRVGGGWRLLWRPETGRRRAPVAGRKTRC